MRFVQLIDASGRVVLSDPDTGARVVVGATPARAERATTAVWSGPGQWTAWTVQSLFPDGTSELRVHDEQTDRTQVLAERLDAFYLCPSPCGQFVSHLSPGPLGLELGVSEIATGRLWVIERGQPLFWAWSADATRLAVHVGDRVLVVGRDGADPVELTDAAGRFVAPAWSAGGSVIYASDTGIVACAPDGQPSVLVHSHANSGRFALGADGRLLAHIETVDASERVVVADLLLDTRTVITDQPTAAFFWSPTGDMLALLVGASPTEVQWLVFDGAETIALRSFRPGRRWFAAVVPFFEQYAQSHSVWSADGTRLLAAAVDENGRPIAHVHHVVDPFTVETIGDTELAWWAG